MPMEYLVKLSDGERRVALKTTDFERLDSPNEKLVEFQ